MRVGEKDMKNRKKYLLSIGFFLLLFFSTFFYIFSKYSFTTFWDSLKQCQLGFILLAFACVFLYLFFNCLFLRKIFSFFQVPISYMQALAYSCTEVYFSAVTPSSTGGQPVEMIYMARDGIPYRKSTLVILINTILYKLVIILLGVVSVLFIPNLLLTNGWIFNCLMLLGIVLNILVILFFSFLIFSRNLPKKLLGCFLNILEFFHLLKAENRPEKEEKFQEALKDYQECAKLTKSHPLFFLQLFGILFCQRISLFFVSFFVYRSFGLYSYGILSLLAMQIGVTLAIDSVPFPGGVMVGEGLTYQINTLIYGETLALSSMLLVRGISFYFLVFMSSIVYALYHVFGTRRRLKV